MQPNVIDVSHWNKVEDFHALKAAGIQAVITKATEGTYYKDKTYHDHIQRAREAGMLVGSYHFADNSNVEAQVDFYLDYVGDDASNTMLSLDWEPHPKGKGRTMSLEQAEQFVTLIHDKTGQWPKLYSGNVVKEALRGGKHSEVLAKCDLWIAHYNPVATWPKQTWEKAWLHQYSETGRLPGIPGGNVDLNYYAGDDLAGEWIRSGKTKGPGAVEIGIGVGGGGLAVFSTADWLTCAVVLVIVAGVVYWVWKKRQS